MSQLIVRHGRLVVRLSRLEKLAALHGDVSVPLAEVAGASVEERPYRALRGVRRPGTVLPLLAAYGVWWSPATGRGDFVALHGRRQAVRVALGPRADFGALLVTVADAGQRRLEVLRAAGLPAGPADEPTGATPSATLRPRGGGAVLPAPAEEGRPGKHAAPAKGPALEDDPAGDGPETWGGGRRHLAREPLANQGEGEGGGRKGPSTGQGDD